MMIEKQALLVILASLSINVGVYFLAFSKNIIINTTLKKLLIPFIVTVYIATYIFIFYIVKFPISGDVSLYFIPQAESVLRGEIPTRDFQTSYMVLFPYVLASVFSVWNNPKSIGMFFTICLVIFSFLFTSIVKKYSEKDHLWIVLSGMLNSSILILGIAYQQDELLILMLIGLLLFFWQSNSGEIIIPVVAVITVLATKITTAVLLPPFLILGSQKTKKISIFSIIILLSTALLLFFGVKIFDGLTGESTALVPPNIFSSLKFIPEQISYIGKLSKYIYLSEAVIIFAFVMLLFKKNFFSQDQTITLVISICLLWLLFLVFSPKSLTSYRLVLIPFVPLLISNLCFKKVKISMAIFMLYSFLVSIHVMLYEDWGKISLHPQNIADQMGSVHFYALSVIEVSITILELSLLIQLFKKMLFLKEVRL